MRKRLLLLGGAGLLALGLLIPAAASAGGASPQALHDGAVRYIRTHGYLPLQGPAGYARLKAAAARSVPSQGAAIPAGPLSPVVDVSWEGVNDMTVTPPDSTGAIGPNSYVELINLQFGIYNRSGGVVSSGTLQSLTGISQGCLSDPQVLWDTSQSRFYYSMVDFCNDRIPWGFSKTDNPLSSSDFCKYETDFGYGSNLPDYPKMGDSKDFLLIGTNIFQNGFSYIGSDVDWINKDAASSSCPASSSFGSGKFTKLHNVDGSLTSTPNPAVMTDVDGYGFVVGTAQSSGSFISVFGLRANPTNPSVPQLSAAHKVTVTSYSPPPDASQCSSSNKLDTLDGRLEHAVYGQDPNHGGARAIWTAQAVSGGGGSEERWYEINPLPLGTPSLFQNGSATSGSLFVYNGGISPDRSVHEDASTGFGGNMVLDVTTSSSSQCTADQMVSKIGTNAQSGLVLVNQATGPENDFSCSPCRWGDYPGATPDPAADLSQASGRVWMTNEFAGGSFVRTYNWEATP